MKNIPLKFTFKGSRNYVQGPDIFDTATKSLFENFEGISNIKYSAHNWIRHNGEMIVNPKIEPKSYSSLISYDMNGINHKVFIVDNDEEITDRVEYSEEYVFNNSSINDKVISLHNTKEDISFSELIVSMNKCFLQSITTDGKWIVTKFEYNNLTDIESYINKNIEIKLLKNLKNKLTKSEVLVNEKIVGYIYFSLV